MSDKFAVNKVKVVAEFSWWYGAKRGYCSKNSI